MQTSGFAELSDFHAPVPEHARRVPGLLAFGAALFSRRTGGRIERGAMLMAAPVTYQTVATRSDDPRQVAHEMRLHWGMNS